MAWSYPTVNGFNNFLDEKRVHLAFQVSLWCKGFSRYLSFGSPRLWFYPAAMSIFGWFIAYQLYRYTFMHSMSFLHALTEVNVVTLVRLGMPARPVQRGKMSVHDEIRKVRYVDPCGNRIVDR